MKTNEILMLIAVWVFWIAVIVGVAWLLKRWLFPELRAAFWLGTAGLALGLLFVAMGIGQLIHDDLTTGYAVAKVITPAEPVPAAAEGFTAGAMQATAVYTDADDATHETTVARPTPPFQAGETVTVAYSRAHPERASGVSSGKDWVVWNAIKVMAVGGLLLAAGAALRLWAA